MTPTPFRTARWVGGVADRHVLDEHLVAPVVGERCRPRRRGETEQAFVGAVDMTVGLDPTLWVEQECVTALAVGRGDAVRDGVVDEVDRVAPLDDDDAVVHLDDADPVSDREMGPFGPAVVGDDGPPVVRLELGAVVGVETPCHRRS